MARRSASTISALRSKFGPLSSDRNAPATDVSPESMKRPMSFTVAVPAVKWLLRFSSTRLVRVMNTL